jgi:hypothetical protein
MAPPFVVSPANPITANTLVAGQWGPSYAVGPSPCAGFQVADITLSSAQILALQTTPVTLIPAPGVTGFFLNIDKIVMRLLAGSAAYTDVGGAVSFSVGANLTVALASNAIFLVTTSPNRRQQIIDFAAAAAGTGVTSTAGNPPTEDNAALTISKATNQFAAGNGTMHITVYYTVEQSL